jgi:hypothetical protein
VDYSGLKLYLQQHQESPFYIYFYWFFLDQFRGEDYDEKITKIFDNNPDIKNKIRDSIAEDVPIKFKSLPIQCFDGSKQTFWLAPFLYFLKKLYDLSIPEWLDKENILKLIACSNPTASRMVMSYNINLDWFEEIFLSKVTKKEIAKAAITHIASLDNEMTRLQLLQYLIAFYQSKNDKKLNQRILSYITETTKILFSSKTIDKNSPEYSVISNFWATCDENHINELFPIFSTEIITSCMRKSNNDINYQYRKSVLEYCLKQSNTSQKKRIISNVKTDMINKKVNDEDKRVVIQYLASLGDEECIISEIDGYLQGQDLHTNEIFTMYSYGVIKKNDKLLNKYISLLFYSTNMPDDGYYIRRENLIYLARNGVQQHLRKENLQSFKNKINKKIIDLRHDNQYTEFYEEFLLQMEQLIYT